MTVIDTKLREAIERNGFKWKYSHSMQEYMYGWWDIVIEPEKWNEEGFIECWEIIEEFNKRTGEIFNTYVYLFMKVERDIVPSLFCSRKLYFHQIVDFFVS